ncbi:hypothetical protein BXZ70DRAFT_132653 [Cristinia sonorae]|uniref:Uncharacterized protein n=1 Tax=Cristinia sonorae TaxID=1940300 RepID=A0A8K0UQ00_9AGAR|nr:hypothetical protein BXZ70DRAFT_132653 [Cristinia sonorae]
MPIIESQDQRIAYYGSWTHYTIRVGDNPTNITANETVTMTAEDGSSLRVIFGLNDTDISATTSLPSETGIQISVCGFVITERPDVKLNITFTIDDETPSLYGFESMINQTCFWNSSLLDIAQDHTLTIDVVNATGSQGGLFLDYLDVTTTPFPPKPSSSRHTGGIIGGTLGATALLMLCLFVLWIRKRRLDRKAYFTSRAETLGHRLSVLGAKQSITSKGQPLAAVMGSKISPLAE